MDLPKDILIKIIQTVKEQTEKEMRKKMKELKFYKKRLDIRKSCRCGYELGCDNYMIFDNWYCHKCGKTFCEKHKYSIYNQDLCFDCTYDDSSSD